MKTLRDYQKCAIDATHPQLQQHGSAVIVLPTGCGKTVVAAKLMAEWDAGPCLFLAHTKELINQAADKIGIELGYRPAVEMGIQGQDVDSLFDYGMCVVGSVQSMYGDRRLDKYKNHPFSLIIIDECFPAGTVIDGRNIESISVGDYVSAFDCNSKRIMRRRVVTTFKSKPKGKLYKITSGTRSITATAGHPFFTVRGWVNASQIQVGDYLYGVQQDVHYCTRSAESTIQDKSANSVLQPPVPQLMAVPNEDGALCDVREDVLRLHKESEAKDKCREPGLLLNGMRHEEDFGCVCIDDGINEPKVCISENAAVEPDAIRGCTKQGFVFNEAGEMQAANSGRERSRDDDHREDIVGCDRTVSFGHTDKDTTRERLPNELQTGPSLQDYEAGNRSGRRKPRIAEGSECGPEKERFLGVSRVDSVEVHELGSESEPGTLLPDGYVYNLEVEEHHTYIANGFAVHNCHHSTASTYRKVIDYFRELNGNLKVVGITATPNRSDGTALGTIFQSVAYQMTINDAVNGGWLTPVKQEYVVVDSIHFEDLKTKKNQFGEADFTNEQLEQILTEEETLHKMAVPTIEKVGERSTLIFTASVNHAHMLASVMNRHRPGCAKAVDGGTPTDERKKIISDFSEGRIQFLANCAVLTEGFDAPECSAIVMGRPTKSLSLYTQMLGRGLRPLPGIVDGVDDDFERRMAILTSEKPNCLVLDFVGNSEHKLASTYDVLGGNYDIEERQLAAREAREGRKDVGEVMEQARLLLQLERQQAERERIKARANYGSYEVDPFGDDARPAVNNYTGKKRGGSTEGQIGFLVELGVSQETAASYTKKQAGAVIDEISSKRCTRKQAKVLARAGINTEGIGVKRASRIIDALAKNNWKVPAELPE